MLFAAMLLLAVVPGVAEQDTARIVEPPAQIEVRVRPIAAFEARDPSRRRFGRLEFRGGMELASPYRHFGGVSAIRVGTDGARFLALTDRGYWLRGRIAYDETARPTGIMDAEMAPILGPDGRPLAARRWWDTESLAEDKGTLYVGIERVHQIVRFDARQGLMARGRPIPVPPELKSLPSNGSLEAIEFVPNGLPLAGTLIAVSERGLDPLGNLRAFLIGGPSPGTFSVQRRDDFDVSDCALLPGGDLLLLERRFSLLRGVAMRIRRIPLGAIRPGAVVDGPVVMFADMGYEIDNMEGLSVHRDAAGGVVLTLISDDNFSPIQRTILLQFTLLEGVTADAP